MLFSSYAFICGFLPITLLGYYFLVTISRRAAFAWLVLCSYVFYAYWNISFLLLLIGSTLFNYFAGRLILASASQGRRNRLVLAAATINLGLLFFYKYFVNVVNTASAWAGKPLHLPPVTLPLGISFFTFTQLAYLVDAADDAASEPDPLNFALFVSFFPHLIAGPLVHHKEMMPQFEKRGRSSLDPRDLAVGWSMFTIGLMKKVLLADAIAPFADRAYAHTDTVGFWAAWIGVFAYAAQLYFDFSGYSDMAIGLARMFGVRFPLNFDSPYRATCIIDFWNRWHMTLTRYITLYIYNPIALAVTRKRLAKGRKIGRRGIATVEGFAGLVGMPTMVTMGLAGIWHGAGLQYLSFGLLHGIYICINHVWRVVGGEELARKWSERSLGAKWAANWIFLTLTLSAVLLGQVFFRADSVHDARNMLVGLAGFRGAGVEKIMLAERMAQLGGLPVRMLIKHGLIEIGANSEQMYSVLRLPIAAFIIFFMPNSQQIMGKFEPALDFKEEAGYRALSWSPSIGWAAAMGIGFFWCLGSLGTAHRFLYFQF
jgi:D-alanyl-lipoteichoic acid acyltransferase DltB (MBOAT superfamily)